jgi:ribosomal protein L2
MQGRALIRKDTGRGEAISVGQLPAGFYLYEVVIGKQSYKGKLVRSSGE